MKTWNRQRKKTRDRLLSYDSFIAPVYPSTASIASVYPWENISLGILAQQIFLLAQQNGYLGTKETLLQRFSAGVIHHCDHFSDFPFPGVYGDLYMDMETEIIYYYTVTTNIVDAQKIALVGGAIVGYSVVTNETYLYLPIRALPMENIILNCGDASEYIS